MHVCSVRCIKRTRIDENERAHTLRNEDIRMYCVCHQCIGTDRFAKVALAERRAKEIEGGTAHHYQRKQVFWLEMSG